MSEDAAPGDFEIVTTTMGAISIRDKVTMEIMHNPVGPWVEANSLYIGQSGLRRRLFEERQDELVIFDVGLGAAANALATLHCARGLSVRRPLRLVSFEREMKLLRFALDHADLFDHFKGFETAVQSILETGCWTEEGLTWELRHGNFVELIDSEPTAANLIFYDPYSSRKNQEMWGADIFRKVRAKCAQDAVLFTYSRATPVRVAFLKAGFYIGKGLATGAKEETTQAAIRIADLSNPLGQAWLERWRRSHLQSAAGDSASDLPATVDLVSNHPQFR
ncbi:MAG TPA: MnmC family methyltransferase [Bdellovibrionales bacterium]|nr:MnmC family methyltransferase [Bdellovibrionales bacterium]